MFVAALAFPVRFAHIPEPGWRADDDILGLTLCGELMDRHGLWTEVERGNLRLCYPCAAEAGLVERVDLP